MAARRPFLLMTRPEHASRAFCEALPEATRASVEILINPVMTIHVTGSLPPLNGLSGLIFTSANGLDAFRELGGAVTDIPVIAVGETTAARAQAMGFDAESGGGSADLLVDHILASGNSGPMLHVRGENAIGNIATRLTEGGVPTTDAVLYEQRLEPLSAETKSALSQDRPIIAPVFSPRTARHLGGESVGVNGIWFAAISQAVAEALPSEAAPNTRISKNPDRNSMLELVADMVSDVVKLERSARQM